MRKLLLFILLLKVSYSFGQWTTLPIPGSGRYDDVFFLDDTTGWAAGGSNGAIYKTQDGGNTWTEQFSGTKYLRSIEFATPTLGFCGSLDSSLYKTTDGGATWVDIASTISPKPKGVCGLAAPTPTTIYGCGIWSSPAYVIKSTDGGNTWRTIDLSSLATALVEVHFVNADTGFVSGKAKPETEGGIILYTTDGGDTWTVKKKTGFNGDYVWKIQTPDGKHYYASIEGKPTSKNVRMIRSVDSGITWAIAQVNNTFSYVQTIGFLDSLRGWTGGQTTLYETTDGGNNWHVIEVGSAYNRFFKVNDSTAYLSGSSIYKYTHNRSTGIHDKVPYDDIHSLKVSPNPAKNYIKVDMSINNRTNCQLRLYGSDGKLLRTIYDSTAEKGKQQFRVSLDDVQPQVMFLVLHTNEGQVYRKIIKE